MLRRMELRVQDAWQKSVPTEGSGRPQQEANGKAKLQYCPEEPCHLLSWTEATAAEVPCWAGMARPLCLLLAQLLGAISPGKARP